MDEIKPSITNDYIFKRIFSKRGNENILKDLLISILNIKIHKIEVQSEVTLEKELAENKLGRLDLLAILDDNTLVNIEIQIVNQHNFIERILFYWSGNYYNDLKQGLNYKRSKKTISINILNYDLFDEGPYHEVAMIKRDYKNILLTDKLELHFIQIPKFLKETNNTVTKLDQWMQFISQKNVKEVELAMEKNKEIKKANEEYEYLTGDAAERRLAYLIDKARRDQNNELEWAKEEGIEEGMKKGIKQGMEKGIEQGMEKGIKQGIEQGMERGIEQGIEQGMERGIEQGIEQGMEKGIKQGIEQGMEKGIEQGILQTKKELVIKLYSKNVSISEISNLLGMSNKEIKEILQKM